jgi:hypothetical protein
MSAEHILQAEGNHSKGWEEGTRGCGGVGVLCSPWDVCGMRLTTRHAWGYALGRWRPSPAASLLSPDATAAPPPAGPTAMPPCDEIPRVAQRPSCHSAVEADVDTC